MIAMTKNVGNDFNKNALYQFNKIYHICFKPKFIEHCFIIVSNRLLKDYYNFIIIIDKKLKKTVENFNILQM